MDKFITFYDKYTIWQLSEDSLHELAGFVVRENYKHHANGRLNIHFSADLLNLPSSIIGWAKTLTGSLKQEYPKLHSGEAIICGKEQNKWAVF